MSVVDLTNSIISGINDGLEQFLEGTLVALLPIIWVAVMGLYIGRPYFLEMIDRFTLRLGADLLWIIYVVLGDLLILAGFVMGFMFFFPDVVKGNQLPITGGLASVMLFGVLLVKLVGDPDHDLRQYRLVMYLLGLGATFYFVPYILGVQFNGVATGGLKRISDFLVTSSNTGWGIVIAYLSIALIAVMGAVAVWYSLRTGGRPEEEQPLAGEMGGLQR